MNRQKILQDIYSKNLTEDVIKYVYNNLKTFSKLKQVYSWKELVISILDKYGYNALLNFSRIGLKYLCFNHRDFIFYLIHNFHADYTIYDYMSYELWDEEIIEELYNYNLIHFKYIPNKFQTKKYLNQYITNAKLNNIKIKYINYELLNEHVIYNVINAFIENNNYIDFEELESIPYKFRSVKLYKYIIDFEYGKFIKMNHSNNERFYTNSDYLYKFCDQFDWVDQNYFNKAVVLCIFIVRQKRFKKFVTKELLINLLKHNRLIYQINYHILKEFNISIPEVLDILPSKYYHIVYDMITGDLKLFNKYKHLLKTHNSILVNNLNQVNYSNEEYLKIILDNNSFIETRKLIKYITIDYWGEVLKYSKKGNKSIELKDFPFITTEMLEYVMDNQKDFKFDSKFRNLKDEDLKYVDKNSHAYQYIQLKKL